MPNLFHLPCLVLDCLRVWDLRRGHTRPMNAGGAWTPRGRRHRVLPARFRGGVLNRALVRVLVIDG